LPEVTHLAIEDPDQVESAMRSVARAGADAVVDCPPLDPPQVVRAQEVGHPAEKLAYTVPEVAERISLGTITVRQLIHAGKLGCVRVGRALVIPRACVEAFLEREATVKAG
jgi:excisionase family DNA binding protein